jgi:hypothetical protein
LSESISEGTQSLDIHEAKSVDKYLMTGTVEDKSGMLWGKNHHSESITRLEASPTKTAILNYIPQEDQKPESQKNLWRKPLKAALFEKRHLPCRISRGRYFTMLNFERIKTCDKVIKCS